MSANTIQNQRVEHYWHLKLNLSGILTATAVLRETSAVFKWPISCNWHNQISMSFLFWYIFNVSLSSHVSFQCMFQWWSNSNFLTHRYCCILQLLLTPYSLIRRTELDGDMVMALQIRLSDDHFIHRQPTPIFAVKLACSPPNRATHTGIQAAHLSASGIQEALW